MKSWLQLVTAGGVGTKRVFKDKAVIFQRGARADRAFVLTSGAVELSHATESGQGVIVKILASPTLCGVIEHLAAEPRYLETVHSAGRSVLYELERPAFLHCLKAQGGTAFECLQDMSMAFCRAARFEQSTLADTEKLLANLFCAYSEVFGVDTLDGRVIALRRSQADFARGVAAGERSVNRLLSKWQELGWVTKKAGRYVLLRPELLKAQAAELEGSLVHRYPMA